MKGDKGGSSHCHEVDSDEGDQQLGIRLLSPPPPPPPLQAPHCLHMRNGIKFGDATLSDTMLKDGLWDAFNDYHMGVTAENVAKQFSISREQQDKFAALSQNRTEASQKSGEFKAEITPVSIQSRKGEVIFKHVGRPLPSEDTLRRVSQ